MYFVGQDVVVIEAQGTYVGKIYSIDRNDEEKPFSVQSDDNFISWPYPEHIYAVNYIKMMGPDGHWLSELKNVQEKLNNIIQAIEED